VRSVDDEERRSRLAQRHLLLPSARTDDVPGIADGLVALHSTDPVTVFLSAMVRMRSPSVAAVEQALYADRTLIRHHAMRRTLWVATPPVVRRMHATATRALVEPERRRTRDMLAANGVAEPDAWLAGAERLVLADLREHGPSTARAVGQRLPQLRHPLVLNPGKAYAGTQGAHTRVLTILGFAGLMLRTRPSSWTNGAYAYAATAANGSYVLRHYGITVLQRRAVGGRADVSRRALRGFRFLPLPLAALPASRWGGREGKRGTDRLDGRAREGKSPLGGDGGGGGGDGRAGGTLDAAGAAEG